MARVTLQQLFEDLDGQHFATRHKLEEAVLEIFNRHVTELPVGFSYMDAIEGARSEGWLHTNGEGHGVKVALPQPLASVPG
jgi:hypothetical protein